MHIVTIVVTKNVAISVKTLHTLLNVNKLERQLGFTNEIVFVNDDLHERQSILLKKIKHCDRIVWIDYSICIDPNSVQKLYDKFIQGYHCIVLSCVLPGINWDLFKQKVLADSKEPVSQMGLDFDTKVSKSIGENLHIVTETDPKCWAIDCKHVLKCLKDKKGEGFSLPVKVSEMFKKFMERGVKMYAATDANLTVTYPHECLGNILQSASISVTSPEST
jgi:hypothetical protein